MPNKELCNPICYLLFLFCKLFLFLFSLSLWHVKWRQFKGHKASCSLLQLTCILANGKQDDNWNCYKHTWGVTTKIASTSQLNKWKPKLPTNLGNNMWSQWKEKNKIKSSYIFFALSISKTMVIKWSRSHLPRVLVNCCYFD